MSPHSWISICLWGGRTEEWRRVFPGSPILQYRLHECIPEWAGQGISWRSNPVGVRWSDTAQVGFLGDSRTDDSCLHPGDESDWTDLERNTQAQLHKRSLPNIRKCDWPFVWRNQKSTCHRHPEHYWQTMDIIHVLYCSRLKRLLCRRQRFRACGRDQRAFRSPFGNLRSRPFDTIS